MPANLLVSYNPDAGYMNGKAEIQNTLTKLGDQKAEMELIVPGMIGVTTELTARVVVEEVREMFLGDPQHFKATSTWSVVDYWCPANVDDIVKVVKQEIREVIADNDQFAVHVITHRSELDENKVFEAVLSLIRGKENVDHPKKVIRIELFDESVSISLIAPSDVFTRN